MLVRFRLIEEVERRLENDFSEDTKVRIPLEKEDTTEQQRKQRIRASFKKQAAAQETRKRSDMSFYMKKIDFDALETTDKLIKK